MLAVMSMVVFLFCKTSLPCSFQIQVLSLLISRQFHGSIKVILEQRHRQGLLGFGYATDLAIKIQGAQGTTPAAGV